VNGVDKHKFNIVDEFISSIIHALCYNLFEGNRYNENSLFITLV
jgi:hypothetical protein